MADGPITGDPVASTVVDADIFPVVTDISTTAVNRSASCAVLREYTRTYYETTVGETTAGVTPTDKTYPPGNVLRYGPNTVPGTTDMTTALTNACLSNKYVWHDEDILVSDVNVPAGVVITSRGDAEISFVMGSTNSGLDLQDNAKCIGVNFDVSGTDSLGTMACIDFEGDECHVLDCIFDGKTAGSAANKFNYTVRFSPTATNLRTRVERNSFKNTFFGVIRQSQTTGDASWSKVSDNTFSGVDKGDAIEINTGDDVGWQIHDNIGKDISGDAVGDGIFIGVAGDEGLGGAEGSEVRRISICNNTGENAEKGIHVEGCNLIKIVGNTINTMSDGTEAGIQVFGSDDFVITGNQVADCTTAGIQVQAESTDQSSSGVVSGNDVKDCPTGIHVDCDTANSSVAINGNHVKNSSSKGVSVQGGADYNINGNATEDCVLGYRVDAESSSNIVSLNGNTSTNDTTTHSLLNVGSSSLYSSGNSFLGDFQPILIFTADDATPSVAAGNDFETVANTGALAITNFDGGTEGQVIRVQGTSATNSPTIADSGNFRLNDADGTMTLGVNEIIVLRLRSSVWVELSRSVN